MRSLKIQSLWVMFLLSLTGCDEADVTVGIEESETSIVSEIAEEGALDGITEAHNVVRTDHALEPLVWDGELAAIADEWAEHLATTNDCIMEHRPSQEVNLDQDGTAVVGTGNFVNGMFIGENLYWQQTSQSPAPMALPTDVVNAWASEIEFYDYETNSCEEGQMCGHYTQVVWADTERVGCAYRTCDGLGSQVWVCNYYPAGNFNGEKPY